MTLWHIKSLKFMLQILTLYFCVTGEYLLSIITLCNGSGGSVCVSECVGPCNFITRVASYNYHINQNTELFRNPNFPSCYTYIVILIFSPKSLTFYLFSIFIMILLQESYNRIIQDWLFSLGIIHLSSIQVVVCTELSF